jgi:hypothetical protein
MPLCTTLGANAFNSCSSLLTLQGLPTDLITTIPNRCFAYCSGLTALDFPAASLIEEMAFYQCNGVISASFPAVVSTQNVVFAFMTALENIDLSSCTDLGGTTGDDGVFNNITGNTISLTISSALINDGDVLELQANNTVTIIQV